MKHTFSFSGRTYEIDLASSPSGCRVRYGGEETAVFVRDLGGGSFEITHSGRTAVVHTAARGAHRWVSLNGRTYELRQETTRRGGTHLPHESMEGTLRAPMPGQVREVRVAEGDEVSAGQVLLLLEAMKMEIRIQSPLDGVVKSLPVAAGEQVEKDQVLVEIR